MRVLTLDFETFWRSKDYTLSKMSPIDYIRDEKFHAQLLGMCYDQEDVVVYDTDESIKAALQSVDWNNVITVAHNFDGFDGLVLSERFGISPRWTLDTMVLMRWTGASSVCAENHASITQALGTGVKMAGTVLSDGRTWPVDFTPVEREAFKLYCAQDVDQCRQNFYRMLQWLNPHVLSEVLRFASFTSRMATRPVFLLDRQMLEQYRDELVEKTRKAREELGAIFHFPNEEAFLKAIRSTSTLLEMFKSLGVEPPTALSDAKTKTARLQLEAQLSKATTFDEQQRIQGMLDRKEYEVWAPSFAKTNQEFLDMQDHPDERVALLARTRLENYSSGERARCENLIRYASQGKPLPILLKTFAAHTSRYGAGTSEGKSAGLNPQNFAHGSKLRQAIVTPPGWSLVACDSSQIECRVLAYEAQQTDLLDLFKAHGDPYANMGSKCRPQYTAKEIHDGAKGGNHDMWLLRQASKKLVLSAGYGVGYKKVSAVLWRENVRMSSDIEKHEQLVRDLHNTYRTASDKIVKFWDTCSDVITNMVLGQTGTFGGPTGRLFLYSLEYVPGYDRPFPAILLPSGFRLRYPNLRQEISEDGKKEFVYDRQRGKNVAKTRIYGGALAENLTQCLAFQILMYQANRMDECGFSPNVNVHDDFAHMCRTEDAEDVARRMVEIMRTPPPWVPGIPLDAEAQIGTNFEVI